MNVDGFNVRIVRYGEKYGLRDCLTNDGNTLVEFYDSRFIGVRFGDLGQFVSRYRATTILQSKGGLQLDGGVPEWRVTCNGMNEVRKFIMEEA